MSVHISGLKHHGAPDAEIEYELSNGQHDLYLRTDQGEIAEDNLGSLPEF